MKFVFRRELGEEHLFVLWQKANNTTFEIPEWIITALFIVGGGLWLYLADKSTVLGGIVFLVLVGLALWFNHRCSLEYWRRPE